MDSVKLTSPQLSKRLKKKPDSQNGGLGLLSCGFYYLLKLCFFIYKINGTKPFLNVNENDKANKYFFIFYSKMIKT